MLQLVIRNINGSIVMVINKLESKGFTLIVFSGTRFYKLIFLTQGLKFNPEALTPTRMMWW